jgi:hypothetical protein
LQINEQVFKDFYYSTHLEEKQELDLDHFFLKDFQLIMEKNLNWSLQFIQHHMFQQQFLLILNLQLLKKFVQEGADNFSNQNKSSLKKKMQLIIMHKAIIQLEKKLLI